MTSVSLLESTVAATKPDNDIQATIPDNINHQQQNDPVRYNKNISKKRPWNQPDLTFTLKRSADDVSSSSSSSRIKSKYPRTQNALYQNDQNAKVQKKENKKEDENVEEEGEDQNDDEEDDDTKEETQIRIKTKRTKARKMSRTKPKKKRTRRKKKRRSER